MEVNWSSKARADYYQILDELIEHHSENIAINFISDVEDTVYFIRTHPEMYPLSDFEGVRKAVINKQVSLFYSIQDDSAQLLRIWKNRSNPDSLSL